jgi:single-strand DNA-binding protein
MLLKTVGVARLTRDVELRYLNSGSAVAKMGFAMSKKYKSSTGEQKEEVCFIDGNVFGKLAEVANQYLRKGSKIYIDAELKFEQWQDQNGQNRSKHVLNINTFEMLDSKSDNQQQSNNNSQQQQNNYNPQRDVPQIDVDEDSIPF